MQADALERKIAEHTLTYAGVCRRMQADALERKIAEHTLMYADVC